MKHRISLSLLLFGAWHIFVSCYSYREIVGVENLMNNTQSRELQERLKTGDVIKVKTALGTFEDIHIVSVNKKNIGVLKWNNDKLHDYHLIRFEDIETLSIKKTLYRQWDSFYSIVVSIVHVR